MVHHSLFLIILIAKHVGYHSAKGLPELLLELKAREYELRETNGGKRVRLFCDAERKAEKDDLELLRRESWVSKPEHLIYLDEYAED